MNTTLPQTQRLGVASSLRWIAAACAITAPTLVGAQAGNADDATTAAAQVGVGNSAPTKGSSSFYAGLDVGAAFVKDFTMTVTSPVQVPFLDGFDPVEIGAGYREKLSFDPGLRVNLNLGVRLAERLHLELQPGWILNTGSRAVLFEGVGPTPDSPEYVIQVARDDIELTQIPLLASLVGVIPISNRFTVRMGFGAGAVLSSLSADYSISYANDAEFGRTTAYGDTDVDVSFAYQAKLGLEYALTQTMFLGIGYQFLGVGETEWSLWNGEISTPNLFTHSLLGTFVVKF